MADVTVKILTPASDFAFMTLAELKKIWAPDSGVKSWKDIRTGFPDKPLRLFGPGSDSGTYDYFAEAVVGGVLPATAQSAPV